MTQSFHPKCPNHDVPLIKTADPGIGICPISAARFSYNEDLFEQTKKVQVNSSGQHQHVGDWGVKHIEGEDI